MHRMRKTDAWAVAACAIAVGAVGCSVHVNKDSNGEDKDVSIHTPFGGMHVNSGNTAASDLGMPLYPGAQPDHEKRNGHDSGSADVRMGFGPWQLRVQVASYMTADPESKVQAFYTKALSQYGTVLTCHGDEPVGGVTRTQEGLTCNDNGHGHSGDSDLSLKAGSRQRQHIVGINTREGPETHFALVSLVLPKDSHESGDAE